jgi:hypothetical protein
MLLKCIAAAAAGFAVVALAMPNHAAADGMSGASPAAPKKAVYKPRYQYGYQAVRGPWPGGPDPYSYSYNRPNYYPSYDSKLWVPRKQMLVRTRYPMRIPEYASSWGYPLACKIHGRKSCGVPFKSRAGDAAHAYDRTEQLRLTGSPRHNY